MPELQSALNRLNELLPRLGPLRTLSAVALIGAAGCQGNIADSNENSGASANNSASGAGSGGGNSTSVNGGNGNGNAGGTPGTTAGTGSGNAPSAMGGGGGSENPHTTTPPPVGGELSNCQTPGPRLIRRLTSVQFRNTLVAVFGGDVPTTDIFADPFTMRFHVDADVPVVRDLDAGLIMDYAETVADWAVKNNKLGSFVTCTTLTDANCRKQFIQNVGLKLEREPISDARLTEYDKLNANVKTFQEFETDVLTAMLESPYFVYRRELGASDSGAYKLTPYEVASELSYFLTQGPPDATLLDAAKNGRLASAADIDSQAERLLATDAGKKTLAEFVDGWLEIDGLRTKTKDQNVFMLTSELREAMIKETETTFINAFNQGSDVGKLLTAKQTYLNQPLAQFYQLSGATDFATPVDLSSSTRAAGVLGQAAFLAQHAQPENSSPVQRGRAIRERFLCQPIPEVPKNLNTTLAPPGSFSTNRERFEQHSKDQVCTGCHKIFDPVGFAFENFDAFGRYRAQEGSHPIDASGTIYGMPEGDVPLTGAQSLIDYLAKSDQVRACLVRYWSYYAHGRDNWGDKKCNDDAIRRESATKGNSLKSVLLGILHAPTFTRRVKEQQ